MNRGPERGSFTTVKSVETAESKWNGQVPDWIMLLAIECDRTSQSAAAKLIGYSGAYVSYLINNKFKGDLNAIEQAVKGALMAHTVMCPGAGQTIGGHQCHDWQKKAQKFRATSPLRIQMHKACTGPCPHSRVGGNSKSGKKEK